MCVCVYALQTVKERMDEDSEEIYRRKFKFSDKKKIEIHVEIPGFQHAINPSKEVLQPKLMQSICSNITHLVTVSGNVD